MNNVARSLNRSISGEIRESVGYEEHIEGVIDELGSLTASVELKELERRTVLRITFVADREDGSIAQRYRKHKLSAFRTKSIERGSKHGNQNLRWSRAIF